VTAVVAVDAKESMGEDAALEIAAHLAFDEAGDGRPLLSRTSQEGFELFANDFMKQSLFGLVAFESDGGKASIGTMRARLLPAIASDVPKSPGQ
jgi:hypothetical protein